MSDLIGRITVPDPADSGGLVFPLITDFGYGLSQERPIVVHTFGSQNAKTEQRYQVGIGPRKFLFRRAVLNYRNRADLRDFWEARQGSWESFTYNVPSQDGSITATKVNFGTEPLSFEHLATHCRTGLTFVEVPDPLDAPEYVSAATCLRFPSADLQAALLSQVQQIIPLVHIRVREDAVSDIYLSDRRCTVDDQLYLPR